MVIAMELRHLRYFKAVATTLNFTRAAEQLHVAQPALSRQIRNLEEELGTRLFDRNRVRVQLTDAGRTLAAHADKILAEVDIAVASVQDTRRGTGGQLMICNDWRLSIHLIPETIAEFRTRHPGVEIALVDLPTRKQIAALRAGHAHVCFLPRDSIPPHAGFDSMLILRAEIKLVVGRRHRLARRPSVRLADFRNETFIRPIGGHMETYTTFVVQACHVAGFAPIFVPHRCSSLEALLALTGAGLGVVLLPDFICPTDRPSVRYLPSGCEPIEMYAVWLRTDTSRLLKDYLAILRAYVAATGLRLDPPARPIRPAPRAARET
jgi:DNA-binding transcriptional LysR family regulator